MKGWMIGGLTGACIGVSIYLALAKNDAPAPAAPVAPVVAAPAPKPAAPVVLPNVIEVTDLDPLLDPPMKPIAGEPFDSEPATVPVSLPGASAPIPPAADEPEVAPMPREVTRLDFRFQFGLFGGS